MMRYALLLNAVVWLLIGTAAFHWINRPPAEIPYCPPDPRDCE